MNTERMFGLGEEDAREDQLPHYQSAKPERMRRRKPRTTFAHLNPSGSLGNFPPSSRGDKYHVADSPQLCVPLQQEAQSRSACLLLPLKSAAQIESGFQHHGQRLAGQNDKHGALASCRSTLDFRHLEGKGSHAFYAICKLLALS